MNPESLTDPQQQRIYERLRNLISPGPAEFFRDACVLMAAFERGESPITSVSHVVGHLLREVESALRDVLEPIMDWGPEGRPTPPQISTAWVTVETTLSEFREAAPGPEAVDIARRVEEALRSALVPGKRWDAVRPDHDGISGHGTEIRAALRALGVPPDDPVAAIWNRFPSDQGDYALHARAHRPGLALPRPVTDEFRSFWADVLTLLDRVLERLHDRFLEIYGALDELIATPQPSKKQRKALRKMVPQQEAVERYFFEHLAAPGWLEPLAADGYFANPPGPEMDEEGRTVFRYWPQAVYLARVAREHPGAAQRVSTIIASIRTDNPQVHSLLLDAVLALPPGSAAPLVPQVLAWIESPHAHVRGERYGKLIDRLAGGGHVPEGLDLARAVLTLDPDEQAVKEARRSPFNWRELVRPRVSSWDYDRILERHLDRLLEAAPVETVDLLARLFAEATFLLRGGRRTRSRSIREEVEHRYDDLTSISGYDDRRTTALLRALRDAAAAAAEKDASILPRLLAALERWKFEIYDRLVMHLLSIWPGAEPVRVAASLLEHARFEQFSPEYRALLAVGFGGLAPEHQNRILAWIDDGPRMEGFAEWMAFFGIPDTEAERHRHIVGWQADRLAPLAQAHVLPTDWIPRYEALRGEMTPPAREATPREAARPRRITSEDLLGLDDGALATMLCSPAAAPDVDLHSLAVAATDLAREEPSRVAMLADRLAGAPVDLLLALFEGLGHALRQGRPFPWPEIITLARNVVDRVASLRRELGAAGDTKETAQALRTIVETIRPGLRVGEPATIPLVLRTDVWAVIEPLLRDPDPAPEEDLAAEDRDAERLAILLAVRTNALTTLFDYADWVLGSGGASEQARSLDAVPEVRVALDRALDPTLERSGIVRARLGAAFPFLASRDGTWAREAAGRLFPEAPELAQLRDRAWRAYLDRPAWSAAFGVLVEQYRRAVREMDSFDASEEGVHRASRLGEHLLRFYAEGTLAAHQAEHLLDAFLVRAPADARAAVITALGRALRKASLAETVLHRLQAFWTRRLESARAAPDAAGAELAAFGSWFASGAFPYPWAAERLLEGLEIVPRAEPDYGVMKHLSVHVPEAPLPSVRCVEILLTDPDQAWEVYSPGSPARDALHRALLAGDEARSATEAVINRLSAPPLGYTQLQSILTDPSEPAPADDEDDDVNDY